MVGGDHVDDAGLDCGDQRHAVFGPLDRRVALDVGAARRIAPFIEVQVMDAGLHGDLLVLHRAGRKEGQFPGGGQVQHVQTRAVFLGQAHGQLGRGVAGRFGADQRVLLERHVLAPARPRGGFVDEDHGRVFAMGDHHQLRAREDRRQRGGIIHQHIAGGCAHEHLHCTGFVRLQPRDFFGVVVGGAKVEGVVAVHAPGRHGVFFGQTLAGGDGGVVVRHVEHAGDAARHGRRRLGGQVALVRQAGLTEMHLIVDHAGDQRPALRVVHRVAGRAADLRRDPFDAFAHDQDIGVELFAFIDDAGVGDQHGRCFLAMGNVARVNPSS